LIDENTNRLMLQSLESDEIGEVSVLLLSQTRSLMLELLSEGVI
jgi:hypothetical protein